MSPIEQIVDRLRFIVANGDKPHLENFPTKENLSFQIHTIPYQGFNLVFYDKRLPSLQQYRVVEIEPNKTTPSLDVPVALNFNVKDKEHHNAALHIWTEMVTYQREIPNKLKASDWEYSGGGLFARPVKVITEWTEQKGYTETLIDYEQTFENLLNAFKQINTEIKRRIADNDKFLQLNGR
jgi:hypothetical protein